MQHVLDKIAKEVRAKRIKLGYTQRSLAEKMHMSDRTIMDLENCKGTPKSETVLLIAKELGISLDAILFPELSATTVSKTVVDFFAGKSEAEIQKYIALCQQADQFRNDK